MDKDDTHTVEYYSATKNTVLPFATTETLRELSQTENKYCMISLTSGI